MSSKIRECSVENCNRTSDNWRIIKSDKFSGLFCNKHYRQLQNHGYLLKRTCNDPNEIKRYKNYAEVILYDKNQKEKARTKIDLEDIKKVKEYKWYENGNKYVYSDNGKTNKILLHRFLIKAKKEEYVDHINHDTLDNRKINLRIVSGSENNYNRKLSSNFENDDIGIYYDKSKDLWVAYIGYKGKNIYLGSSNKKEDLIELRRKAEINYFEEYHYNYKELKKKGMIK